MMIIIIIVIKWKMGTKVGEPKKNGEEPRQEIQGTTLMGEKK